MPTKNFIDPKLIECNKCHLNVCVQLPESGLFVLPPGWSLWWDKSDRGLKVVCAVCAGQINGVPAENYHPRNFSRN